MPAELKPVFTNPGTIKKICELLDLDYNAMQHLNIDIDVTGRIYIEAKYYAITYTAETQKEVF